MSTAPTPSPEGGGNAPLVGALGDLRAALLRARLPLSLPGRDRLETSRGEMVDQLEDYVLPRLVQLDAPLLTVVGGSTGAGKSTLVNSLVGEEVSQSGVLRPTTRSPVLVHHPGDREWFDASRVLPEFERTTRASADPGALQLVATERMPAGLAILDAPDIDSVEEQNRTLATQLLAAADMWLFVTSAARYADQVPWDFLRRAAERSTALAVVLDRTPPAAAEEVTGHLRQMLRERGLAEARLFTVPESPLEQDLLAPRVVGEIREWLERLAADSEERARVVRQTLDGAVRQLTTGGREVADGCGEQDRAAERLRGEVGTSYARALEEVDRACADGTLLRGEVLARWQEFVGTGELLRALESRISWLRDRVTSALRGRPQQAGKVSGAVESGLETLIWEHAESAAERTDAAWRSLDAGRTLLEHHDRDLSRAGRDLRGRTERTIRDWQQGVLELVRSEGADKRSTARFLALGVNGLAVSLMVVVFAHTGGLVGGEIGIAGGSAVVGQKLLEAVFGDQAVRRLAAAARTDLHRRVDELLQPERERYLHLLEGLDLDPGAGDRLRAAVRRVEELHAEERR